AVRRLKRLATWDSVTHLLNRPAIMRQARVELSRATRAEKPLSIIMMDIDHFKNVNDRYGHLAGDQALRSVADMIRQNVRPYDAVGRWGGEEFLLVLPETTVEQAVDIAERVRTFIATTSIELSSADAGLLLSVSLGVSQVIPEEPESLDKVLSRADAALYQAKGEGRDRVCAI
ncbi:MAG: GGDEF domain-containing protein, partial [Ardenticatenaceae bacterium]